MKPKRNFRVGMKVSSVYDPSHLFVIDRAVQPDKIFHEKGSKRWWTQKELQPRSKVPAKLSAKAKKEALASRYLAFMNTSEGLASKSAPVYRRTCLYCGTEFTAERKQAKFCKARGSSCRTLYWRQRNEVPVIPVERLRAEKAEEVTA